MKRLSCLLSLPECGKEETKSLRVSEGADVSVIQMKEYHLTDLLKREEKGRETADTEDEERKGKGEGRSNRERSRRGEREGKGRKRGGEEKWGNEESD